ncbi:hypothetical protein B0H14DRAFT_2617549 [Mycena olivaceomarginata]|nr:hypothetical protein B0H14DRAFT_2617549 [Mycena olivaceomarginata]
MANPQAQSNSLNPLKTALDTMTAERDTALQRVEELVAQRPSTQVLLQELQQLQAEVQGGTRRGMPSEKAMVRNARGVKMQLADKRLLQLRIGLCQRGACEGSPGAEPASRGEGYAAYIWALLMDSNGQKQRDSASEAARLGDKLRQAKLDGVRRDLADARRESVEQRKTAENLEAAREQAAAAAHDLDSVKAELVRVCQELSQQVEVRVYAGLYWALLMDSNHQKQRDSASEAASLGDKLRQVEEDRDKHEREHSTAVSQLQAKLDGVRRDLADARRESGEQRKTAENLEAAREQAAAAAHDLDSVKAELVRVCQELSQQVEKQRDSASEAARMDSELRQLKEDRDKREMEYANTVSEMQATLNSANAERDSAHRANSKTTVKNMELEEQLKRTQAGKIQRPAPALSVTLSDNGSPVPVEFGFEDLEEPEDSIPDSGPEPAPHRMPHVVGPPPVRPPPSTRASEAPASSSMPLYSHGVGPVPRPPAPASEPEASISGSRPEPAPHVAGPPPPSPRATEAATAPPVQQQPMLIMLPPATTAVPRPPDGYDDWLHFYQTHKLQRFAAAQLERPDARLHYTSSARCIPANETSRTPTAQYPFDQTTLQLLASFHNATMSEGRLRGNGWGKAWPDFELT